MNILYIHGLDSKLSAEKREILEKFGTVFSPDVNYYTNPAAIESIIQLCSAKNIDSIIGTSIGGFAGFYVCQALNKPAMLFNPALKRRSVEQILPVVSLSLPSYVGIILGKDDEVVNPKETLDFLDKEYNSNNKISIDMVNNLGHNIPLDIFEEKVSAFISKISQLNQDN